MADIAEIGFAADTSELKQAKSDLQALVPPTKSAEQAADKLAGSLGKVGAAASGAAAGANTTGNASQKAAAGVRNLGEAIDQAVFAKRRAAVASASLGQALDVIATKTQMTARGVHGLADAMQAAATAQMASQGQVVRGVHGLADAIGAAGKSAKLTSFDLLNLGRQAADVGVTAAMGMNPFMIAIQQGPQILDAMQVAAMRSGTTVGAVFRALGVTIWTALAPILPFILAIGAAVAVVAGGFALFSRAVNKGNQDIIGSMGLTEKQLERVKKSGVETGVTLGDTFMATAEVIGEAIMNGPIGDGLKWLGKAWNEALDFITEMVANNIATVIGVFVAAFKAIANNWRNLPAVLGAFATLAANGVIGVIEKMVNQSIKNLNMLISFANNLPGIDLPTITPVSIARIELAAGSAGGAIVDTFREDMESTRRVVRAGMSAIGNEIGRRAGNRVRRRIKDAAGDAAAGPKNSGGGGKSDGEKFSDIVNGANRDINTLKAQIEGVNMTAAAAARLANEQKLLNEAQQKGLTLTDAQRAQLIALAGTMTDLQTKLKNLQGFKEINEGATKSIVSLLQQAEQIGVVGEALLTLQYQQGFMNEATSKGITLDAEQTRILNEKAVLLGKLAAATQKAAFMENMRVSNSQNTTALREELSYIGLSADATNRLRIENDLLGQARRANIVLTPEEIQGIKAVAAEQAGLEQQVRQTRDAFNFAKDSAKGFITDIRNGLTQGKSLWESFGNAVVNVLNKIADKMLDAALDNLFSGGKGGSSGGGGGWVNAAFNFAKSFFANGAAFGNGGVQKFAKGSAFTNDVVTRPTMFKFANGTALGEMGEAGPEAIMPLKRGPNGSLGVQMYGGASAAQRVQVDLRVTAEEGEMFRPTVKAIAEESATSVTRAGIEQYDQNMPSRVHQIASDERVR